MRRVCVCVCVPQIQLRTCLPVTLSQDSVASLMPIFCCCSPWPDLAAICRPKRAGEVDGKDYIFVSKATFEQWIQSEQLLEHALVYGDYKGIPKDQVCVLSAVCCLQAVRVTWLTYIAEQVTGALARGTDVALRLDVQGAATVRKLYPHAIFLFLVSAASRQSQARRVLGCKARLRELCFKGCAAESCCAQVAESEQSLVQRLVERKSEPLVRPVSAVAQQTALVSWQHWRSLYQHAAAQLTAGQGSA